MRNLSSPATASINGRFRTTIGTGDESLRLSERDRDRDQQHQHHFLHEINLSLVAHHFIRMGVQRVHIAIFGFLEALRPVPDVVGNRRGRVQ
jgi:hypothetical protein